MPGFESRPGSSQCYEIGSITGAAFVDLSLAYDYSLSLDSCAEVIPDNKGCKTDQIDSKHAGQKTFLCGPCG